MKIRRRGKVRIGESGPFKSAEHRRVCKSYIQACLLGGMTVTIHFEVAINPFRRHRRFPRMPHALMGLRYWRELSQSPILKVS